MTSEIIGFIGLGNMGSPMAGHLVRAGYRVIAFDIDADRQRQFSETFGLTAPESPADLHEATVILTMVPTGAVVRQALNEGGDRSLLNRLKPGTLVIDTTSSPPASTRELGAILKEKDIHLIDAPVSGGGVGARNADLVFMMGGDDEGAVERASAVLSHLGKRIFRLGPLGSGHTMKAMNNYVSAAGYIAACEAVVIGERYGLDRTAIIDVLNVSTGRNFATETSMKRILAEDFSRNFALDLFTKDLKIAADLGEEQKVKAPLTHLVHDRMNEARNAVGGDGDHTTAFPYWEKQVG